MTTLSGHKDRDTTRLIRRVRRERKSLVTANEAFVVHSLARAQASLPGDLAEVGVYQGSTARLICEVKGDKALRLFDTFEGLPMDTPTKTETRVFREHQYRCSMASVQEYLAGYDNVHWYKGTFPESTEGVEESTYCLAHFDVDLYQSTLDCLEYFYPRMVPGGIMLSHDYSILEGVRVAFTEFLEGKPEGLIELPSTQCMVVKQ